MPKCRSNSFSRRDWLKILCGAGSLCALEPAARAAEALAPSATERYDFAWFKGRARALSERPYRPRGIALPEPLASLDWDHYQSIHYRPERALFAGEGGRFRVRFFHLGLGFREPVEMYELGAGRARRIVYEPSLFDFGDSGLGAAQVPKDLGFAGFQLAFDRDFHRDVAAFLGASYFRAVGGEMQYGLSARGLAVNCGMDKPEEFPLFTEYWFERPSKGARTLRVYAILDSKSIAGAFRFDIAPGPALTMDVDVALYPRTSIERLGIAPLTSMFLCGEGDRRVSNDWRPEIHDSDGLSLWTGKGEHLFRPLTNPPSLRFNAFLDDGPKGFGLVQRDLDFDHYQDDGAFYDRRPSAWVEPKSGFGEGAVALVELPAPDETGDNIVAFWNPKEPAKAGRELLYAYRILWGTRVPLPGPWGQVVATRTGIGGVVGRPRRHFSERFVVDFSGEWLRNLEAHAIVEPVITASRGTIEITSARPLRAISGYRAMFDLKLASDDSGPVDIRLYLREGERALTETWLLQWTPPPPALRKVAL